MAAVPLPANEAQRLEALRALNLLDTPPEERFDRITRLTARVLGVPTACLALIDENRIFFKSRYNFEATVLDREGTFASYMVLENKQFVVPDARLDERFKNHPHVIGNLNVRFFIGSPIATADGSLVGALTVTDHQPRIPSAEDLAVLHDLALMAQNEVNHGELALAYKIQQQTEDKLRLSEARFREVVDIPGKFVWETTVDGKTLFMSERVEEVLGYSAEEMGKRGFFEGLVEEDAVIATAKFFYAAQQGQRFSDLEFRSKTKAGDIIWLTAR